MYQVQIAGGVLLLNNYLGYLMCGSPEDDVANAMSGEKGHYNVAKPYMILDACFGCQAKKLQHR